MAQKRNKNSRKHKKHNANKATVNTQNFANLASTKANKNEGAYGYTLQAIPCNLTEEETKNAQLEMFQATNKVSPRTWIILAVTTLASIAGITYFKGAQTIFFWLLLVGVALYFLVKFVGIKAYMKRELDKQAFPEELKDIKLGLQPHGLVLSMPQALAMQQMQQQMGSSKGNKSMMTMMNKNAGRDIPWSAMTDWKETENYFMIMFEVQGQQGSQLIPKRMQHENFPIEKLAQHLKEEVKQSV